MDEGVSAGCSGNAVVPPPGPSTKDRLVLSESSSVPHYVSVEPGSGCTYKCDKSCLNFGAMQICSHVVAAAESNGELSAYISCFKKAKGRQPANMTRVAKRGLPAGAGRKGEKPAKKRQPCSEPPDDGNRIPFTPPSQITSQRQIVKKPQSCLEPPDDGVPPSQMAHSFVSGIGMYGPPAVPTYNRFGYMHIAPPLSTPFPASGGSRIFKRGVPVVLRCTWFWASSCVRSTQF